MRGPGAGPGAATVWLTGLSGAGKTTIGRQLVDELHARGQAAVLLDGDEVREHLTRELGFSREDRDRQVERVGWLCGLLNREGVHAGAALVSPFREARDAVRARVPRFIEVHVEAPVEVLHERDPKGHYRRFRSGELTGLTGLDAPYEVPLAPEIVCRTDGSGPAGACVGRILDALAGRESVRP